MRRKSVIAMVLVITIIMNFLPFNVVYGAGEDKLKIGVYTQDGVLYQGVEVDFLQGDTAYSALARVVGNIKTTGSGSSIYVSSIQGVAEFDGGPFSGWVYAVNGVKPEVSAGAYYLNPGDKLVWHYTLDLGEDIYLGINKLDAYIAANPPAKEEEVTKPPIKEEPEAEKPRPPVKEEVETEKPKNEGVKTENSQSEEAKEELKEDTKEGSVEESEEKSKDIKDNKEKEDKVSKEDLNKSIEAILGTAKKSYGEKINSLWEAIALKNLGGEVGDEYVKSLLKEIKEHDGIYNKVTDLEKNILLLNMLGYDVTDIDGINLLEILLSSDVEKQGSNGVIFAIICLNSLDDEVMEEFNNSNKEKTEFITKGELVEILLTYQNEDGGFSLVKGKNSDIDITAMALQALGGSRALGEDNSKLDEAILKALDYLKSVKFENSESVAQTIIACSYIDVNPESFGLINLIEELLKYKNSDNTFKHVITSESGEKTMSTEQGVLALLSYKNQQEGKPFIFKGEINREKAQLINESVDKVDMTKVLLILSGIIVVLIGALKYKRIKKANK